MQGEFIIRADERKAAKAEKHQCYTPMPHRSMVGDVWACDECSRSWLRKKGPAHTSWHKVRWYHLRLNQQITNARKKMAESYLSNLS